MKAMLTLGLVLFATVCRAGHPTLTEVYAAVRADDSTRIETWIRECGVRSPVAANVLLVASVEGNIDLLDRTLALGVSPNTENEHGTTALICAAKAGATGSVRRLLEAGAAPDRMERCADPKCQGHTPLMNAACAQDLEAVRLLLAAGADPRLANHGAGEVANQQGHVDLFRLLEQHGGHERLPPPSSRPAVVATIPISDLGLTELLPAQPSGERAPGAHPSLRLSVISDDGNRLLGDLVNARLTRDGSFELIERQELDRVLAEQQLNRAFALQAANYGRVAALLNADALLLICDRQVAGTRVVESRLIRVYPGLTLDTVYSSVPVADPPQWAERMGSRISGLATKIAQPNAIALSLLNIRASMSGTKDRGLDRSLAVMLGDRLAHQPHIVLLERGAMERLTQEGGGEFWTGSYLVDGTIEPSLAGDGAFTFSVRFEPAGGGEPLVFTAAGQRLEPAQAIDDLMRQINTRLAAAVIPPTRDMADEASNYIEEARWAFAARHYAAAQSAAEAAWALGLRSMDVAELRVRSAMLAVRDLCEQAAGPDTPRNPGAWLDLAIHGCTVWEGSLKDGSFHDNPDALAHWLQLGLDLADDGCLALLRIPTALEKIEYQTRIENLSDALWNSLQDICDRSAGLPSAHKFGNQAAEKQAAFARLLIPDPAEFLPAIRGVLDRQFSDENTVTRARIRANLLSGWRSTMVMVNGHSVSLNPPRNDEASRQLSVALRNAPDPEDRFVGAMLALRLASLRLNATSGDVARLCECVNDMHLLLAEGGGTYKAYWEEFEKLDKLNGVRFFTIQTLRPNENLMLDRHVPEHTEFRRQLFLRIAGSTKAPASDFKRLIYPDQYTPEQMAEVQEAQARLNAAAPPASRRQPVQGGMVSRYQTESFSTPPAEVPPAEGRAPLDVWRLWVPWDHEPTIDPEFRADGRSWAGERIWVHGYTLDRGGRPDKHYLFVIEPNSLRTDVIPLPDACSALKGAIVVTPDRVVLTENASLLVLVRSADRWDVYDEIRSLGTPVVQDDSVYALVVEPPGNAILALNLTNRSTEVIASTRRRPAASPFDDPGLHIKSIAGNPDGEIVVVADTFAPNLPSAERVSHAWSPEHRTWRQVHPLMLASAAPRLQGSENPFRRVGTVGLVDGEVCLRLRVGGGPATNIPVAFVRQASTRIPPSRYGGQNIRPESCEAFDAGLLLVPRSPAGLWILPQQEIDDYLHPTAERYRASADAR